MQYLSALPNLREKLLHQISVYSGGCFLVLAYFLATCATALNV